MSRLDEPFDDSPFSPFHGEDRQLVDGRTQTEAELDELAFADFRRSLAELGEEPAYETYSALEDVDEAGEWLWPGQIMPGEITMLAGESHYRTGKGFLPLNYGPPE